MSSPTRPHIVVLDGHTLNPGDLSWRKLECLGRVTVYPRTTTAEEAQQRSQEADVLLVNKVPVTASLLNHSPRLRYIAVTATGYNNVDLEACAKHHIPVSNAIGYGSASVAQHVFALLLHMTNRVAEHSASVQKGDWSGQPDFSYWHYPIVELSGKTMGIYGLGRIGQQVALRAQAFGMSVRATHRHPKRDALNGVTFVDLPNLFAQSDVISLNVPLNPDNQGIVDRHLLNRMKPSALLINTARGGLINETDLAEALRQKKIAGAALDVLAEEPPKPDHPLLQLPNCWVTPHQAWASVESRQRLLDMVVDQVRSFLKGQVKSPVTYP